MRYIHGILFSPRKKWSTELTHVTPWKHNAKWKKPVTKDIFYRDPFTQNIQNRQIHKCRDTSGFQGLEEGEDREWWVTSIKAGLGSDENSLTLNNDSGKASWLKDPGLHTLKWLKWWILRYVILISTLNMG